MRRRRGLTGTLIAGSALLCAVLSGCSDGDEGPTTPPTTTPTTASSAPAAQADGFKVRYVPALDLVQGADQIDTYTVNGDGARVGAGCPAVSQASLALQAAGGTAQDGAVTVRLSEAEGESVTVLVVQLESEQAVEDLVASVARLSACGETAVTTTTVPGAPSGSAAFVERAAPAFPNGQDAAVYVPDGSTLLLVEQQSRTGRIDLSALGSIVSTAAEQARTCETSDQDGFCRPAGTDRSAPLPKATA